jgi:AraC-like DNA-binding protein
VLAGLVPVAIGLAIEAEVIALGVWTGSVAVAVDAGRGSASARPGAPDTRFPMNAPLEPDDSETGPSVSPDAIARAGMQRMGGMVALPGMLRDLGLDPAPLIAEAGLTLDAFSSPENRAPFAALMHLATLCRQRSGVDHFALLLGQRWNLSHFGLLGRHMRSARSVKDALQRMAASQHRHSDVGLAFVLDFEATSSIGYVVYRDTGSDISPAYDIATAFTANIVRELCGPAWRPVEVLLARRTPADPRPYQQAFGCPVRFDSDHCAVRFSSHWLDQPPVTRPTGAEDASAHPAGDDDFDPLERPHRTVRLLLVEGRSSGDDLARILDLNRRTLTRRLSNRGTSFRQVLDEVRYETARQLLCQTDASIEEISSALCYSEVSAFTHAFRRWSGTTPGRFRATARNASPPQ